MERSAFSLDDLADRRVESWADIHGVLDEFPTKTDAAPDEGFTQRLAGGIAFLTFGYGIDGVSIEIAKYASCLEQELRDRGIEAVIHCIGGDFISADEVLAKRWHRKRIDQANGWSKWDGGIWFDRMFRAEMPSGSAASLPAPATTSSGTAPTTAFSTSSSASIRGTARAG